MTLRFPATAPLLAIWAAVALLAGLASPADARVGRRAAARANPVVVELFTAQGCAACPQANALLQELSGRKGVLALTWPVDYWDYLGWPDTFAKPEFTARQRAYVTRLKLREVYTPEMVVGGRREAPGFDRDKVQALIAADSAGRRPGPRVRFLSPTRVEVAGGGAAAEVWLARFDPAERTVKVVKGENRGKTVVQQNVVTQLEKLGAFTGRARQYTLPAAADPALKTAILVQASRGGVLASAMR